MKRIFLFALFARHCTWENVCVCWEIKRAAIFFSPFQRSTRGGSSRRINAFVSRAIAGVFRAIDSVHCRNERASLEEESVRGTRAAIIARFIAPLRFCSGRKETGEEGGEGRDGEKSEKSSVETYSVSFLPFLSFFFSLSPFSTLTFQLSLPRIRGFVRRYACLLVSWNR